LRQRKGLAVYDGPAFDYADYKQQQFDLLADKMREHIDMDKIYRLMTEHQQMGAQ
jgi:adenosylcobyric acid synthase